MKLLFENWRTHLNEISFEDAKKRLETKALTKWIKGMAFDEETGAMTLSVNEIEAAKNELAKLVLEFVPEDLTDVQQGTTLEWIISNGINDPYMKQKFYNEAIASTETDSGRFPSSARADLRIIKNDLERYWHTHEYSSERDIFKIKTFGALAVSADRAKRRFDAAQEEKDYLDADKGIEVFRDDDEWRIYALHNKGAACKLGKGTSWCTAAPGLEYFEEYYEPDDPLFYFEDKRYGDTSKRFQFHFGSDQFMDEEDHQVDEETRDYFIDLLAKTGAPKKYKIVQYWVTKNEVAQTIYDEKTTPEELMAIAKKYAGNGEKEIIETIIDSDNVTGEVLEYILLNDADYGDNALSNPKITDEFINRLAYSEDATLRYMAAYAYDFGDGLRNKAVSVEALDKLSEDPETLLRMRIAMHPFALPETLAKMANRLMKGEEKERVEGMLSNLLRNDNLPSNLFAPLVKWSKTRTAEGDSPKSFRDSLAPTAVSAAALNPNAPAEVLREIGDTMIDSVYSKESNVSYALAQNPNTPEDILLKLSKSKIPYIRNKAFDQLEDTMRGVKLESLRESFKKFMK